LELGLGWSLLNVLDLLRLNLLRLDCLELIRCPSCILLLLLDQEVKILEISVMMPHIAPDIIDKPTEVTVLAGAVEEAGINFIRGLVSGKILVLVVLLLEQFIEGLLWWEIGLGAQLSVLAEVVSYAHILVLRIQTLQSFFQIFDLAQLTVEFLFEPFELLLHLLNFRVALAHLRHLPNVAGRCNRHGSRLDF
jgi:hypothetical protein